MILVIKLIERAGPCSYRIPNWKTVKRQSQNYRLTVEKKSLQRAGRLNEAAGKIKAWSVVRFGSDVYGPQKMNLSYVGQLTFSLAPPAGCSFHFLIN